MGELSLMGQVVRLAYRAPFRRQKSEFVMAAVLLGLGFFLINPIIFLFAQSFSVSKYIFITPEWGLENWRSAFQIPGLLRSLGNSFLIWSVVVGISFPIGVLIAWTLARTDIRFSHGLEFLFWISWMMPGMATTIAWVLLLNPRSGFLNTAAEMLPFVESGPFNIFSIPGIIFAHVVANGISLKVMLLTPAFRNMDMALEEAGRVSGASNFRTMLQITLPLMLSPMTLVFAFQLLRIFQSFEIEQLLGTPFSFFVYSTMIFKLVRTDEIPQYGEAAALASITLVLVALIIPTQRWIIQRRRYTTISSGFKMGLIKLGRWHPLVFGLVVFLISLLIVLPVVFLGVGSFMQRAGFFQFTPTFTLMHWQRVLTDYWFLSALKITLILSLTTAIVSPLLFVLVAYILVKTNWPGRGLLDALIWGSGAIPGMLAGFGLLLIFLFTPGLSFLYGTIWPLLIVVILQGNTLSINLNKGILVQVGQDMEDAARVAGAGWWGTFFKIWIPILMPTMALVGTFNFVLAAGATGSVIMLAPTGTMTLSVLALEWAGSTGQWEAAAILSLVIISFTVVVALVARGLGLRLGIRHDGR